MSKPIANFAFTANNLHVNFQDLSTNTPTSWLWKFGGTPVDNTTQNPSIDFTAPGTYNVILISSNADGASDPFLITLVVSNTPGLNITIEEMVKYEMPNGLATNETEIRQLIKKWQLYLQPIIYIPLKIDPVDTFNEAIWDGAANVLISKLVIRDYVLKIYQGFIFAKTGPIKHLETGPATAEWHDPLAFIKTLFHAGGFMDALQADICMFGRRAGVTFPFCPKLKVSHLFIVSNTQ